MSIMGNKFMIAREDALRCRSVEVLAATLVHEGSDLQLGGAGGRLLATWSLG